jgi:hypothetical protein
MRGPGAVDQRPGADIPREPRGAGTKPWAESLPVPVVEATIQFASDGKGRLLLRREGRLVYQDPDLRWWFAYGW